jgi:hypothetical protein
MIDTGQNRANRPADTRIIHIVPHKVLGFTNHNKNYFIGLGGKETLCAPILRYLAGERTGAVEHRASSLLELSMRHGFTTWLPAGTIFRGWHVALSAAENLLR